jgi:hypothetical protein
MLPKPVIRTEGISVRVMIRTKSISVTEVTMQPQLVGFFTIERACVKLDEFVYVMIKFVMKMCL